MSKDKKQAQELEQALAQAQAQAQEQAQAQAQATVDAIEKASAIAMSTDTEKATIAQDGNVLTVFKEYKFFQQDGTFAVVRIDDVTTIATVDRMDKLMHMKDASTLGLCVELAIMEQNKVYEQFGFKTIGKFGASKWGLDEGTIKQYARVGRVFLKYEDTEEGRAYSYAREWLKGATVSNLMQALSLIDGEKALFDSLDDMYVNAVSQGRLHLVGLQAVLKEDMKKLRETDKKPIANATATPIDGQTEGQTDGQTEGQTEGQTDGQTEGQTDGQTDGETVNTEKPEQRAKREAGAGIEAIRKASFTLNRENEENAKKVDALLAELAVLLGF